MQWEWSPTLFKVVWQPGETGNFGVLMAKAKDKLGDKTSRVLDAVALCAEPEVDEQKLSTGSTLLNLACSDDWRGGFAAGRYYFVVGDSASGKTFLCMTCFAEALLHPVFRDYRLIYDNVEDGCLIDLEKLFNAEVAKRIESPATFDDGSPAYSETVEEFYFNLDDAVQQGKPFVYVLDSMDALSSESEGEKFDERKKAFRRGKEAPGSYGDGKAKRNSEGLRKVLNGLRSTGSILIILSQTRDNLGFGFEKKTRSGGHALKFYATLEIWSSIAGSIKKMVGGKQRAVGTKVSLRVKKNRITGKNHEVQVDIYPSYGIDDVGSCVDYLVDEKCWPIASNGVIDAVDLKLKEQRDRLIGIIEKNKMQDALRRAVSRCWKEVSDACALKRMGRYAVGSD